MSVNKCFSKVESWCLQKCPLCGQEKTVIVNGAVFVNDHTQQSPDRGYSFCNCRNIFFTDWSNIDQDSYFVPEYVSAHYRGEHEKQMKELYQHYIKQIKAESNGGKKVLDLGSVTNYLLNFAQADGFDTTGWDILKHEDFGHKQITGDFDKISVLEKFDIIYSNHFFEHIHYPLEAIKKCYEMLNVGGLIFISMPDPFQIWWENYTLWGNFILRQHHILWDKDSFCDEMEAVGFKTIFSIRNYDIRRLRDMHLLFKK
jgi:SAM-dependent methyltransferase